MKVELWTEIWGYMHKIYEFEEKHGVDTTSKNYVEVHIAAVKGHWIDDFTPPGGEEFIKVKAQQYKFSITESGFKKHGLDSYQQLTVVPYTNKDAAWALKQMIENYEEKREC